MAGPSLFANLARVSKVLALLLFFLPWVAVSCSPDAMQRIEAAERGQSTSPAPQVQMPGSTQFAPTISFAKASGLNMAMGSVQLIPLPNMGADGRAQQQPQTPPDVAPEIAVIAGAALIIIALIVTFLRTPLGFILGAAGSLLAAAAFCFSVFIHYPPVAVSAVANSFSQMGPRNGTTQPNIEQLSQIFVVKPEGAFYFMLLMLVVAAVLNIVAMRKLKPSPAAVF